MPLCASCATTRSILVNDVSEPEFSRDAFLGGRIHLWQPKVGYRAGIDPVLLAACVPGRAGQSVLELGCGGGTALACLNARVSGLSLTGVELQDDYADLARRNIPDARIVHADLRALPADLRQDAFDHVIANPPYFETGRSTGAEDAGRSAGRMAQSDSLSDWVSVMAKRLRPRGWAHMIQRVERLPELLAACEGRLGSIQVLPVAARAGRPPHLVILRARKGRRAAFRLLSPLVLHDGTHHDTDRDSYRTEIAAVLRDGAGLEQIWAI